MKKLWILLFSLVAVSALTHVVAAQSNKDALEKRLEKVGSVCVEGEDCAAGGGNGGGSTQKASNGGGESIESIFNRTCATCHKAGVAGAPKYGSKEDWAPRIAKGKDALYHSAINGKPPGMPPKGTCMTCSEQQLKDLVDYMVSAAQ